MNTDEPNLYPGHPDLSSKTWREGCIPAKTNGQEPRLVERYQQVCEGYKSQSQGRPSMIYLACHQTLSRLNAEASTLARLMARPRPVPREAHLLRYTGHFKWLWLSTVMSGHASPH